MVKKSWLPKYFAIAIGCIVAVFAADASAAFGSRFQGNVGYSIVGNNVYLTVDQVLNTDTSGSSNTLRLELWALSSPLTGGSYTGYRLAVYPLGTLSAGAGISNINSGALPYSPPPNGRWYLALTLDEFDNLNVDDGYGYDEYHNFPNAVTFPAASPGTASVVEYYYAAADHYFITATPSEIAALDSNRFPGWLRTGLGFGAYAGPTAGANPVCRYYIPPASHFYSASPAECALTGQRFPSFVSEPNSVFYIALPDTTTGACPGGAAPIYRLFDNRADPNHRFTTSTAVVDQMSARGWIPEGYGPGPYYPIMCSPNGVANVGGVPAGATDGTGSVVLTSNGLSVPVRLVDQDTGAPLAGVAVGLGYTPTIPSSAVLFVVDRTGAHPLQIILLEGQPTSSRKSATVSNTCTSQPAAIPISGGCPLQSGTTASTAITLTSLAPPPSPVSTSDLQVEIEAAINALLNLDPSQLPAGFFGPVSVTQYTPTLPAQCLSDIAAIIGEHATPTNFFVLALKHRFSALALPIAGFEAIGIIQALPRVLGAADTCWWQLYYGAGPQVTVPITELCWGGSCILIPKLVSPPTEVPQPTFAVAASVQPPACSSLTFVSAGDLGGIVVGTTDNTGSGTVQVPSGAYTVCADSPGFKQATAPGFLVSAPGTPLNLTLTSSAPTCSYSYSPWSACQPNNTQTRTVLSSSPPGCVGTPLLSQSCTYAAPCCGEYFDTSCTVFGAGGCWRQHSSTYSSGGVCQVPPIYILTLPGACTCDPNLYQVCQ